MGSTIYGGGALGDLVVPYTVSDTPLPQLHEATGKVFVVSCYGCPKYHTFNSLGYSVIPTSAARNTMQGAGRGQRAGPPPGIFRQP